VSRGWFPTRWLLACCAGLAVMSILLAGCGGAMSGSKGKLSVVAAEDQYGNVAGQIGGKYISVMSVENNPNTDPHTYEVSPGVASAVSSANLVIQNGIGYDDFMSKIESASGSSNRQVITVQTLLGLPDSTANPHLWYRPTTMPTVARAIATALSGLQPAHRSYFRTRLRRFLTSLDPWVRAIARYRAAYPNVPVATTEPVSDYLLEALGMKILTPATLETDVMNGGDPSPQDVFAEDNLLGEHRVKVFVYNQQVTDSLTQSFIDDAKADGIPIVGVYETMPTGFTYQSWMLAEVSALRKAVAHGRSTVTIK
jgi:zinc/manganese transport system substrate-binding protein